MTATELRALAHDLFALESAVEEWRCGSWDRACETAIGGFDRTTVKVHEHDAGAPKDGKQSSGRPRGDLPAKVHAVSAR